MDDKDTMVEHLKDLVRKFCEDRDWDQFHNPKDLAIGISTEANELLELFRFKSEEEMRAMMREERKEIGEELADVLYFVLRFAQKNSFDLTQELINKLKINERKYPVERSRGSNKKYRPWTKNAYCVSCGH